MTEPRAGYYNYQPDDLMNLPDVTVYEQEPEWTGLYDAQGRKLVRARPRMGFDLSPRSD